MLGHDTAALTPSERFAIRRDLQVVFQDPMASLDPRLPIGDILAEPLETHDVPPADRVRRVRELLALVGLQPEHANRYPQAFSGGQRQRIGIARALALEPKVVVLDEPVSALDVSIRAGIINLLEELQAALGLSYLFVAHDLSVIRHIADRVAVMYLGRFAEIGAVDEVFERPAHPYTQALLSAIPLPDPRKERQRRRIVLQGDLPNPADPPSGCRFRTRCQKFATRADGSGTGALPRAAPAASAADRRPGPPRRVPLRQRRGDVIKEEEGLMDTLAHIVTTSRRVAADHRPTCVRRCEERRRLGRRGWGSAAAGERKQHQRDAARPGAGRRHVDLAHRARCRSTSTTHLDGTERDNTYSKLR